MNVATVKFLHDPSVLRKSPGGESAKNSPVRLSSDECLITVFQCYDTVQCLNHSTPTLCKV